MPLEMALDLAVLGLYDIFIYAGGFDTDWGALHDFQPPNGVCTCLPCAVMHMGPVLSSTVGWSTHPMAGCLLGNRNQKWKGAQAVHLCAFEAEQLLSWRAT